MCQQAAFSLSRNLEFRKKNGNYYGKVHCLYLYGMWHRLGQIDFHVKGIGEALSQKNKSLASSHSYSLFRSRMPLLMTLWCKKTSSTGSVRYTYISPHCTLLRCPNKLCRLPQPRHDTESKRMCSRSYDIPHPICYAKSAAVYQGCERSGRRSGRLTIALPFLSTYATMPADIASGRRTCCKSALPIEPSTLPCTELADLPSRLNLTHIVLSTRRAEFVYRAAA